MAKCVECGRLFQEGKRQTRRQKFCSSLCRLRNWQRKNREKCRQYNKRYREKLREKNPKHCIICQEILPSPKSKYCSKDCYNRGQKIRQYEAKLRRRKLIDEIKLKKGCQRCGYNKCARALDFHHKINKRFQISGARRRRSLREVLDEISKCIILCKNCHSELMEAEIQEGDV